MLRGLSFVKGSPLSIKVDIKNRTLHCGNKISGVVTVEVLDECIYLEKLTAVFVGREHSSLLSTIAGGVGTKNTVVSPDEHIFLYVPSPLFTPSMESPEAKNKLSHNLISLNALPATSTGRKRNGTVVIKGSYQYPFEFEVPQWVPPSACVKSAGSIEYEVRVSLVARTKKTRKNSFKITSISTNTSTNRKDMFETTVTRQDSPESVSARDIENEENQKNSEEFTDSSTIRSCTESVNILKCLDPASSPFSGLLTKDSYKFMFASGTLSYSLDLNNVFLTKGELLRVGVSLKNTAGKKIPEIEMYLQQYVTVFPNSKVKKVKKSLIGKKTYKIINQTESSSQKDLIWKVPEDISSTTMYGDLLVPEMSHMNQEQIASELDRYQSISRSSNDLIVFKKQQEGEIKSGLVKFSSQMPDIYKKYRYGVLVSVSYLLKLKMKVALGKDISEKFHVIVVDKNTVVSPKVRRSSFSQFMSTVKRKISNSDEPKFGSPQTPSTAPSGPQTFGFDDDDFSKIKRLEFPDNSIILETANEEPKNIAFIASDIFALEEEEEERKKELKKNHARTISESVLLS